MIIIWKNIKSMLLDQRRIFVLVVLTQILCAYMVCFAFGVLYNNRYKRDENQYSTMALWYSVYDENGVGLSYAQLEDTTKRIMKVLNQERIDISCSSMKWNDDGIEFCAYMEATCDNGIIGYSQQLKEYEYLIIDGNNLTEFDYEPGVYHAIVAGPWEKSSVLIGGQNYTIVGRRQNDDIDFPVFICPLTVDNQMPISQTGCLMSLIPTRKQYDQICMILEQNFSGRYEISEYFADDADTRLLYNTIGGVIIGILVVAIGCLVMQYSYIFECRKKKLTVFRLCGCTRKKSILMHIIETLLLSIPSIIVGMLLFHLMRLLFLDNLYPYMKVAFSGIVYLFWFGVILCGIVIEAFMLSFFKTRDHIKKMLQEVQV